ncbi:AraC family transcriptional regulator [Hyalangium rubrum]|uniref:Helix-turn-helix domain-containing protein n=1 Tax=Hyalangium rubrum TaxID=3103134 RepID=A0ABU5HDE3_9BACT|nr:helix-turn-helix domain-containing protein [Hyalangium sp. s54d21]MDY7230848.1 helix-turn-helix domain-containing protein [Hyalangium sp. s54d21]
MPATTTPGAAVEWMAPPSALSDRIDFLLWQPRGTAEAREHAVAPDANVDLLLELSDSSCRAWLHGPVTRLTHFRTRAECGYCVVHFHPGAVPALVDASAAELVDASVEVRRVGRLSVDELGERLSQAGSGARRQELLGEALGSMRWPLLDTFDRAWRHMVARGEMPTVAELAGVLHLSPRTLERAFQERLGLSPRMFKRIFRLQRALEALRSEPVRSLAEVALASGYADHAHLTREFRSLVGQTPSQLRG